MNISHETLYTCLMEEQTEEEAFVQVYWARAEHIGAAIEKMRDAARFNGLSNPEPREVDDYDIENLKATVQPGPDAEVFWATNRHSFPPEPIFTLPYGIIGSCLEGEHDVDEIMEGFTRSKDDQGEITIAVNVQRPNLLSVYEQLLRCHSTYRVFWYLVHDHWDDTEDFFLVNESLDDSDKILSHLNDHELDAIANGYVTLTAYHEKGATNLNISDHKLIVVITYSDQVADKYTELLNDAGYEQQEELVAIDYRIHHWHYRHPDSRTKDELMKHLRSIGFRDWKPQSKS